MTYYISVIPKQNNFTTPFTFEARKMSALKRVLPKKKIVGTGDTEAIVTYKTKQAAYTAAAKVRNHVHGVTAKVYPSTIKY